MERRGSVQRSESFSQTGEKTKEQPSHSRHHLRSVWDNNFTSSCSVQPHLSSSDLGSPECPPEIFICLRINSANFVPKNLPSPSLNFSKCECCSAIPPHHHQHTHTQTHHTEPVSRVSIASFHAWEEETVRSFDSPGLAQAIQFLQPLNPPVTWS